MERTLFWFKGSAVIQYHYFIKRLGSQEMGSRVSRESGANRGRYILIPTNSIELFPHLSKIQENDHAFIGVTPVFRMDDGCNPPKCYLDYVYHNSKVVYHQPNGRNERRIYLSKKIDQGGFFQGDIIVMRRRFDIESSLPDMEEQKEELYGDDCLTLKAGYEYYIDWLRPDLQPEEWGIYDRWITALNGVGASSVIINERIDMFESKVSDVCPGGLVVDDRIVRSFDNIEAGLSTSSNFELSGLDAYAELFNSQSFRDFVLTTYGNTCAVTHEAICYGNLNNLEAAHIHPRCHGGYYLPQNGIAMRRDIHWAFDKGMFFIDPHTLKVHVHRLVKESYLGRYDGTIIRPKTVQFAPQPVFLEYHKRHIFGSFVHTGSLKNLC